MSQGYFFAVNKVSYTIVASSSHMFLETLYTFLIILRLPNTVVVQSPILRAELSQLSLKKKGKTNFFVEHISCKKIFW